MWILEDSLSCFSYAAMATFSVLSIIVVLNGGGVHRSELQDQDIIILYFVNISQVWYGIATCCIRTVILLLYLRIFSPRRGSHFDMFIRALLAFNWTFYLATTIVKVCQCLPRNRIWDSSASGTCVNLAALLIASGLFNIVSELVILVTPIKVLWSLNLSRKKKIGIYLVFTVGFM